MVHEGPLTEVLKANLEGKPINLPVIISYISCCFNLNVFLSFCGTQAVCSRIALFHEMKVKDNINYNLVTSREF